MNDIATPDVIAQATEQLSGRHFDRVATARLADALENLERPLEVTIHSVEPRDGRTESPFVAIVAATIGDIGAIAEMLIQEVGHHVVLTVRFADEDALPPFSYAERDAGRERLRELVGIEHPLVTILDLVDFEHGSGAARLGDARMRYLNNRNCFYDRATDTLHLSDIVIRCGVDEVIQIPCNGDMSYLVNGVRLDFALDSDIPDYEEFSHIGLVPGLLDRMRSGETTALRLVVNDYETMLGLDDIEILMRPTAAELRAMDRTTMGPALIELLAELEYDGEDSEPGLSEADKDAFFDFEAGTPLEVKLGASYVFTALGDEGLLNMNSDGRMYFSGMDMYGRMLVIDEIEAASVQLAA